jgi:hypothetical protein
MECLQFAQKKLQTENPKKHPILTSSPDEVCRVFQEYQANEFAKVKQEVTDYFTRERVAFYAEKYKYLYHYIQMRYPSDYIMSEEGRMNALRQLIYKLIVNQMLAINDDYYYVLFEYYSTLFEWGREFAWIYSHPITLMIIYEKTT